MGFHLFCGRVPSLGRPGPKVDAESPGRPPLQTRLMRLYLLRRNRISRTICSPFSVRSVLMVIEADSLASCSTTYPGEARLSTSVQLPRRQDLTSSKTFPYAALLSSPVFNPRESHV